MDEYLSEALNEISDKHLSDAIRPEKKRRFYWPGAVAAALAVVLLAGVLSPLALVGVVLTGGGMGSADPGGSAGVDTPTQSSFDWLDSLPPAGLVAEPQYPEMVAYPNDAINTNENQDKYAAWSAALRQQYDQPEDYASGLPAFFTEAIPLFLAESEENAVCSPLNIYMALAMLAETTGGDSRSAVLSALNADSIEALRTQAGHVWNAHYRADGAAACLLANSLWLNEGYAFDRDTVTTLTDSYYASVYQGDLGSAEMNDSLRSWLSDQTLGLLDGSLENVELSAEDALALASTVYFRAKWASPFWAESNTAGLFHSPGGDVEASYMNETLYYGPYYYGADYGAVRLGLDGAGIYGDAAMWLILPDEGYDPWDILESGYAMDMILCEDDVNRDRAEIKVHLSLPKFDISAETDLKAALTALGLGDLFSKTDADFSAILPDTEGAYLGKTTHAARVAIDEEGVTAAAYTQIAYVGAPVPPEEEIYFTLDRPFLFVITSPDNLPLFVGVVNEP